jgi:PAS domain S-box-containing protein
VVSLWQRLPYLIPLIASVVISAALVISVWPRRRVTGGTSFIVLMASVMVWSLAAVLTHTHDGLEAKLFWTNVQYIGVVFVPAAWFVLVMDYTGRGGHITPRTLALLAVHPILTHIVIWTDPLHAQFRTQVWLETQGPFPMLGTVMGPAFWAHTAYSYGLLFVGAALLLWAHWHGPRAYRRQSGILFLAVFAPWMVNALSVFQVTPFRHLDLTPFGFTVTGLAMSWSMWRHQLLDLIPVARDQVLESMHTGVIVLNLNHRVVDINPAARHMLGLEGVDMVGMRLSERLPEHTEVLDDYREVYEAIDEVVIGEGWDRRVFELQISPLRNTHGDPVGRLVVGRDITDRKRVEAALRESERQLRIYANDLESRNVELDAFAHTVAHDLKAPLATLTGYGELIETAYETLNPQQVQGAAKTMAKISRKMGRIVDELLLMTRLESEALVVDPMDMGEIVMEACERLRQELESADAALVLPEAWPVVLGYEPWVEEVWVNYISNAIKYGGRPPRIELGFSYEDSNHVRFWVQDNGEGLSPAEQARLFVPFERLEQIRIQGTGLGLSIARRIIERLSGEVGVESPGVPGEGSRFYFILPVAAQRLSR